MQGKPESAIQVALDGFHCPKRQHLYENKQLFTKKLPTYIYLIIHMPQQIQITAAYNSLTNYPGIILELVLQIPVFLCLKTLHILLLLKLDHCVLGRK